MARPILKVAAAGGELSSRRERKKQRTRREIYDAAVKLFMLRGFADVTIDDICRAADVAKGTFFLHFPTKDAILAEYGQRTNEALMTLLNSVDRQQGAYSELRLILTFLAERAARHKDVVRLLVREGMVRPSAFERNTEQSRDLSFLVADVIRRGQREGEFRRELNPMIAAVSLCSSFFAFIYEWAQRGTELDIPAAVDQTLDIVMHGLADKALRKSAAAPGKTRTIKQ